jgi:hypothetical protein
LGVFENLKCESFPVQRFFLRAGGDVTSTSYEPGFDYASQQVFLSLPEYVSRETPTFFFVHIGTNDGTGTILEAMPFLIRLVDLYGLGLFYVSIVNIPVSPVFRSCRTEWQADRGAPKPRGGHQATLPPLMASDYTRGGQQKEVRFCILIGPLPITQPSLSPGRLPDAATTRITRSSSPPHT